jgi:hypothetical protein
MTGGPAERKPARWGKRIGIGLALMPLIAVLGHAIWVYSTGAGLKQRVAAIQARGEPILPADFAPPALPPDVNGGPDIDAAGHTIAEYFKTTGKPLAEFDRVLPLRPEERQAIEQAMKDLAPAVAQFQKGRAKPRHEPTLNLISPVLMNIVLANNLNGQRALCMLFDAAARLEHENGDDATALRRVYDMIFVSRYTDKNPSLVGHLVSIGCLAMASETVNELAPDLRVGIAKGDAAPADVRRLIDTLLDDGPPRKGLRLAFRGERMGQLDTMDALNRGIPIQLGPPQSTPPTSYKPVARYLTRPMFNHNARSMIDHMTALLPVVDEPDLPAALAKLPPKPKSSNPFNAFTQILIPSLERALETQHRVTSDRRLAATAMAIRWYQLDHNGQRPPTLDALVPKYLPSVPKDALLRDKPLGYLPEMQRPRLYSAGANNVDDGGSDAFLRPFPDGRASQRGDEWRTLDRCVFLDRQPRPTPEADAEYGLPDGVGDLSVDDAAPTTAPATQPAEPATAGGHDRW